MSQFLLQKEIEFCCSREALAREIEEYYIVGVDSLPVRWYRAPGTRYDRLKIDPVRYIRNLVHGTLEKSK